MVVEYQPGRCILSREALFISPLNDKEESIDTSKVQIHINPEVFTRKEKLVSPDITSDTPIWESECAEIYATAPGLTRFVIWEHKPGDEGVKRYIRFDDFDPLPHHYYESEEEYAQALKSYKAGTYPDKRVDVNGFFDTGLIVDFGDSSHENVLEEVKAA
jgi:hypothetical protein